MHSNNSGNVEYVSSSCWLLHIKRPVLGLAGRSMDLNFGQFGDINFSQSRSAMEPRRQRRKVGLTRMDAALDAMLPYGFAETHVRNVIKHLLKEYGGNEGWPFIEEYSYKELIEAILCDLGASDETTAAEHENPSQIDSRNENLAGACGPAAKDNTSQGAELHSGTANPTSGEADHCMRDGNRKCGTGIDLGPASRQKEREIDNDGETTAAANLDHNSTRDSASLNPPSPTLSKLRGLPGYEWIESDEEDPEEFVDI